MLPGFLTKVTMIDRTLGQSVMNISDKYILEVEFRDMIAYQGRKIILSLYKHNGRIYEVKDPKISYLHQYCMNIVNYSRITELKLWCYVGDEIVPQTSTLNIIKVNYIIIRKFYLCCEVGQSGGGCVVGLVVMCGTAVVRQDKSTVIVTVSWSSVSAGTIVVCSMVCQWLVWASSVSLSLVSLV